MADISKIKLADGTVVTLKDGQGRTNMNTLLGTHSLTALGDAAWLGVDSAVTSSATGVATTSTIKSYVDAQIGTIHKFDIIVCEAEAAKIPAGAVYKDGTTVITGTMAASDSTMFKLYLVKNSDAGSGAYVEWISIKKGTGDTATYSWEAIGSTAVDLSGYVQKTRKVGSNTLENDITVSALKTDLGLKDLAFASTATGSTTYDKVTSIDMKSVTVSGNASVTTTDASATIQRGAFTPAGAVTGSVTAAGTVSVVLSDATATISAADITYGAYTPQGTVAAVEGGNFAALKTAAFSAATSTTGVQIEGTVTAPSVNLSYSAIPVFNGISTSAVLPSFSDGVIGTYTAASLGSNFYSVGTAASWTGSSYSAPTLSAATKSAFATNGIVASFNASASASDADYEMLVFASASTGSAVTAQGSFNAGSLTFGTFAGGSATTINTAAFTGGSWVAGTFNPGVSAAFSTVDVVPSDITAALANAPVFSGNYYSIATTSDTALKTVAFTGSSANIKPTSISYLKPAVSSAAFSGTSVDISAAFSGTTVSDALVTGVSYKKADSTAAFSVDVTPEVSAINTSTTTLSITVSAD